MRPFQAIKFKDDRLGILQLHEATSIWILNGLDPKDGREAIGSGIGNYERNIHDIGIAVWVALNMRFLVNIANWGRAEC